MRRGALKKPADKNTVAFDLSIAITISDSPIG